MTNLEISVMTQFFITVAAILGGLSVAAGAFASHALLPLVIKCIMLWRFFS
jgi:uncharacterized membrane protein YgdD (TMEM256/DUF423 family)